MALTFSLTGCCTYLPTSLHLLTYLSAHLTAQFQSCSLFLGSSENYQADGKAFIFSLNYTSQSYLFKKEISEASSSSAIYSSLSTGPTFGEAPFDFQIGINGNMREGSSQHVISYRGGNDVTDSNLGTVLAGASNFTVSDVEVLYKEQGGTLLVINACHCIYFRPRALCKVSLSVLIGRQSYLASRSDHSYVKPLFKVKWLGDLP